MTSTSGVPNKPSATLLRARSTADYDEQGRVFRTTVFSVNQSTGAVSTAGLRANTWYDRRGNVIKSSEPGGLVSKAQYDGAGRAVKSFATGGGGDASWADAGNVTGDKVLSQGQSTYDGNGNEILSTTKERFHEEAGTGELGDPSTGPKARVSYSAAWYDRADRLTASAEVGTNGGTAYARPASVPARSDAVLVTDFAYDAAGMPRDVTDPRGTVTRTSYDLLGRQTKVVEAYADGVPSAADDRTTLYAYDGAGNVVGLTADLPAGQNDQTTQYVYGVTASGGTGITSNDLLREVRYPDESTGAAGTAASDREAYAYNALGDAITFTDQNGTVHAYSYDVLGRPVGDEVTTLGSGVDGSVRKLATAYDTAGRAFLFTSLDAAGLVASQVQRAFNGLGQLTAEYQSHSGAVDTSTTPKVQYAYSEMAGGANHSQLRSMTYPDGRVLRYEYAAGLDDAVSRVSLLADDSGGAVGTRLEEYSYLGSGTIVQKSRPQPGVGLTYVKQGAEANGEAGDQYAGLDRFGRLVDQRWLKTSDGTHADRFGYGYDRNSNVLFKDNKVNPALSELYHANGAAAGYDALDRLTDFRRGTLTDANSDGTPDTVATASRTQGWTLDPLGNWASSSTDGTATARTHDSRNQATAVGGSTLTFDANGNTTKDETGKQYAYDAWDRLKAVSDALELPVASYTYDALGRRVTEAGAVATAATHLYYSAAWQVLEERDTLGAAKSQYVWGPGYADSMVLRDRDADGSASTGTSGREERLYVQHDVNHNVASLTNTVGVVQERFAYDPYGAVKVLAGDWTAKAGGTEFTWRYLHQGGRLDPTTGLYHFRNREFSPTLGRWMQQDPAGYVDGPNLYQALLSAPVGNLDPLGLEATETDWEKIRSWTVFEGNPQAAEIAKNSYLTAKEQRDAVTKAPLFDHPEFNKCSDAMTMAESQYKASAPIKLIQEERQIEVEDLRQQLAHGQKTIQRRQAVSP